MHKLNKQKAQPLPRQGFFRGITVFGILLFLQGLHIITLYGF